ncbi:T9SS type A sorting domain-containing protein [Mariniflexile sp.]|uniref:T9SS type A sorting domain-containing protein n=1 Tax=Mariniflexile sp. TaxID=1979402 RepID=UPI0040481306
MKKITKTFTVALIFCWTVLQTIGAQTEYKLDSIQNFNWDESAMALLMTIREHYTYANEGANYTNYLHIKKTNGIWVNNQQTDIDLNNLGFPSVSTNQTWDSNTNDWLNVARGFYTYNGFNAPESVVNQLWDNSSMIWWYVFKDEFLYNDAQRQTKQISYLSQNYQDIWIPNNEFEIFYDVDGRTLAYINRNYDTGLMQMVNDEQTVNTIIGGVFTELLQQEWDTATDTWINTFKREYVYNNDLLEQINDFSWEEGAWQPARQVNYTYNGNGQIETSTTLYYFDPSFQNYSRVQYTYTNNRIAQWLFQSWDIGLDDWRNTQKWNDVYDANDNLIESTRDNWDTTIGWKEYKKTLNFYSEVIPFSLSVASNELLDTKIYPNPASEVITVKTLYPVKTIKMYDMLGKLILTTTKSTIRVDAFQNGLYLLKIETDKGQITKKIMIE